MTITTKYEKGDTVFYYDEDKGYAIEAVVFNAAVYQGKVVYAVKIENRAIDESELYSSRQDAEKKARKEHE